eukprot:10778649-Alexandrium_andersonii.AAC.1
MARGILDLGGEDVVVELVLAQGASHAQDAPRDRLVFQVPAAALHAQVHAARGFVEGHQGARLRNGGAPQVEGGKELGAPDMEPEEERARAPTQ